LGRCAQFGTLRIVGVALAVARTAAISDIPAGLANCHSLGMDRDDSPRTYIVRAINPKLEPPGVNSGGQRTPGPINYLLRATTLRSSTRALTRTTVHGGGLGMLRAIGADGFSCFRP
jgi:hypothetical protein